MSPTDFDYDEGQARAVTLLPLIYPTLKTTPEPGCSSILIRAGQASSTLGPEVNGSAGNLCPANARVIVLL